MGPNQKQLSARAVDELNQRWSAIESAVHDWVTRGLAPSESASQHVRILCAEVDDMARVVQAWFLIFVEKLLRKTMDTLFTRVRNVDDILPALQSMAVSVNRLLDTAQWLELHSTVARTNETMSAEPMEGIRSGRSTDHLDDNDDPSVNSKQSGPGWLASEVRIVVARISGTRLTPEFDALLLQLFQRSFRAFHKLQSREDCSQLVFCPGCGADIAEDETRACRCPELMTQFVHINKILETTCAFPKLLHDCVHSVAFERIWEHVRDTCQGDFESKCAANLKVWLEKTVAAWLQTIAGPTHSSLSRFKERLYSFLVDIFIDFRAGQLFDMIVDFPDSQPALEDLRGCLSQTTQGVEKLVPKLREAMERRLFHPGVKTADIITAYVSTIKALRILDASGRVLQSVCEPLSTYLKSRDNRDNTVRIIVSSLTDENNVELRAELAKCSQKGPMDAYGGSSDEEEGDGDWQRWVPHARVSKVIRSSDIITLLVNIYGSKEVFVDEYASLLAERLLNGSSDTEKEIIYMEQLKARFGEVAMNNCEVMLNDVKCSKRLYTQIIKEKLQGELKIPLDILIVSVQFWPELKDEAVKIPSEVTEDFKKFRHEYQILNSTRTVNLRPQLGWVELQLELDNGSTKNFKCSTGQAALINLFHERNQWKMSELATALECSRITVKRWASFWVSAGILRETGGFDTLVVASSVEDLGTDAGGDGEHVEDVDDNEDEEDNNEAPKANQQMETKHQVYWSFVRGLLSNLGEAPLDRVFSMLNMFVSQASQEFTLQDCKHFLDLKVRSGDLVYMGGVYTLANKPS